MSVDQIKINLDHQNSLMLYHYFTELSDALRPILHNPAIIKDQTNLNYWYEKLFQLRSIINDIIDPGNRFTVQLEFGDIEKLIQDIGKTETKKDPDKKDFLPLDTDAKTSTFDSEVD